MGFAVCRGCAELEWRSRQSCRIIVSRSCSARHFSCRLMGFASRTYRKRSCTHVLASGCCPSASTVQVSSPPVPSEHLAQVPRTAAAGKASARTMAVASATSGLPDVRTSKHLEQCGQVARTSSNAVQTRELGLQPGCGWMPKPVRATVLQEHRGRMC